MIDIKTDFGVINISKSIIAKIICEVSDSYDGRVVLTNHKGKPLGIAGKIGVLDESSIMDISFENNNVDIRFFVMLRFGDSIGMITNELIDSIRSEMVAMTGLAPNSISVVVTGMISKGDKIVKRSIEVKK